MGINALNDVDARARGRTRRENEREREERSERSADTCEETEATDVNRLALRAFFVRVLDKRLLHWS